MSGGEISAPRRKSVFWGALANCYNLRKTRANQTNRYKRRNDFQLHFVQSDNPIIVILTINDSETHANERYILGHVEFHPEKHSCSALFTGHVVPKPFTISSF